MHTPEATLTAIVGPMYSGKTEELMRLIKRALIVKKRVLVMKSPTDQRSEDHVVTRGLDADNPGAFVVTGKYPAHTVHDAETFMRLVKEHRPDIIAIDETQFFGDWLFTVVNELLEERKGTDFQIIVVGLDMDYLRRPFVNVAAFLAIANEVIKTSAFCFKCMGTANFTQKNSASRERIEADSGTDSKTYEARCRSCHTIPREHE